MDILDSIDIVDKDGRSYSSVVNESYEFRFGDWLSEAFQLLNKNVGWYILFVIILFGVSLVCGFIPFIGRIINSIVTGLLIFGIYSYAKDSIDGRSDFEAFFQPFQHAGPLILILLLQVVLQFVAFLPVALFAGGNLLDVDFTDSYALQEALTYMVQENTAGFVISILVGVLLVFAISVFLYFAPMFVMFGKLPLGPALNASFKVISKNYFMAVLFLIVTGLLTALGVFVCFVGLLYTLPIFYLSVFVYYKEVVGLQPIHID